jgi:hypothetical protein
MSPNNNSREHNSLELTDAELLAVCGGDALHDVGLGIVNGVKMVADAVTSTATAVLKAV